MHAARRRQIRLRGLRDFGRSARRRRFGGECAVRAHGGRSRARPKALPDGVRARQAEDQITGRRQGAEPPRHQSALPPGPGDFRRQGAFCARARVQDDALESLPVRRRRNSLVVRQGTFARQRRRAGAGDVSLCRRPERLPLGNARRRDAGASRHLYRQRRQNRHPRRRAMGGGLDRRRRRLPQLLLQHHPDTRWRHARIGLAFRPHPRPEGPRRARRPGQARRLDHLGRRDDRRRRHALGVHSRAGIPGPDQRPARHRRGATDRRAGDQGPVRPLARRQSGASQQAVRLRGRARRGAHPPPPGKRHRPQERGAQAPPARQARRLHQLSRRRLRAFCRRGR